MSSHTGCKLDKRQTWKTDFFIFRDWGIGQSRKIKKPFFSARVSTPCTSRNFAIRNVEASHLETFVIFALAGVPCSKVWLILVNSGAEAGSLVFLFLPWKNSDDLLIKRSFLCTWNGSVGRVFWVSAPVFLSNVTGCHFGAEAGKISFA